MPNDSHQRAAEFHDLAAHAHRVAATHYDKGDHKTGHEYSRQAMEHSKKAYQSAPVDEAATICEDRRATGSGLALNECEEPARRRRYKRRLAFGRRSVIVFCLAQTDRISACY
jgi:hypothetical protein